MKFARDRKILQFYRWLTETVAAQFPDSLLKRMLLYALHTDENFDVKKYLVSCHRPLILI